MVLARMVPINKLLSTNCISYQSLRLELQVGEVDIPGEDAHVEVLRVQVLNVLAQQPVQDPGDRALEHGDGG